MTSNSHAETKAGIYLLLGLGVICTVILLIGEIPEFLKPSYELTVEFADASGLTKGSDVTLSGAVVGRVTNDPQPVVGSQKVDVHLRINRNIQIRRSAQFSVASEGFLGGDFVEIKPKRRLAGSTESGLLGDGDRIEGTSSTNLSTLMHQAMPLIAKANDVAVQIDDVFTKLNTKVLTPSICRDLKETIQNFPVLAADSRQTKEQARELAGALKSKQGVLGRLLYDKDVRTNIAQFMTNYAEHGAIFYDDDSAPKKPLNAKPSWRARP
jgi:ABC-type transporter Mla subunit MlaD